MLPLRHLRRWQIASLILLIVVLFAALMPAVWFRDNLGQGLTWFQGVDKWLHGVTFAILSVWFAGLYEKRSYWRIGLGLLLFGLMIEACQRVLAYRTADWLDVGADAAGIAVGLVIAIAGIGGWCLRLENRWMKARRQS